MASSSSNLYDRVVQLLGRGKNQQQVINAIRQTKGGKSINVRYIKSNIAKYQASQKAAERIGNIGPNTPISKTLNQQSGQGSATIRVSFHFTFNFSTGTSSGRVGKQSVYMTADVPASTTKSELIALLKEKAADWIDEHYPDQGQNASSIRISLDSSLGV